MQDASDLMSLKSQSDPWAHEPLLHRGGNLRKPMNTGDAFSKFKKDQLALSADNAKSTENLNKQSTAKEINQFPSASNKTIEKNQKGNNVQTEDNLQNKTEERKLELEGLTSKPKKTNPMDRVVAKLSARKDETPTNDGNKGEISKNKPKVLTDDKPVFPKSLTVNLNELMEEEESKVSSYVFSS